MGFASAQPILLKAKVGDEFSVLVADRDRTAGAFERGLGLLVAKRGGLFVIGFGGVGILRPAAPALRKGAHPLQRAGVRLRRRPLKQRPRADIVLRAAD